MAEIRLVPFNQTRAWAKLQQHAARMKTVHLGEMFAGNPNRAYQFSIMTPNVLLDFSRQRFDQPIMEALKDLAEERQLQEQIRAMFSGEKINTTEKRAVLHTALRYQGQEPILVDGKDVMPEVRAVLAQVKEFADGIHKMQKLGATGHPIKNIVHIGIGGSFLGPEYLAKACAAYAMTRMNLRFVANVDATDFVQQTQNLNPEETVVIIASKTFTTAETMQNARTAREWVLSHYKSFYPALKEEDIIKAHFVAVSTAEQKVAEFGINLNNMFPFWDWVGGRYSATSAIGALPISLFLGYEKFQEILNGAYWMDQHFLNAPIMQNIPIMAALIDIWNINFMGWNMRALLPYAQAYAKLSAHTQQVEMESNGKMVDCSNRPIDFQTGEVVFGEPGTNGQHSFYQLIHQGAQIIPCTFIGFIHPQYERGPASAIGVTHHQELMTNFLAQPDALAFGGESNNPAKRFEGNRPSSSLLLEKQNPFSAGLILAYTEHVAATKGFLWKVNSFDQFGVELGKVLGTVVRKRMQNFNAGQGINTEGLNTSSAILLMAILSRRLPT